ncbi:tRNA (adenosine(37)-N6)-dimethylallyltransferase MiaA [Candidatus Wolfebacteria bacterium]|nr:tRNA (adenosine(37)-N6)-dimethylallyltransferase MiaA [Candidatus Wolfebacteria bacterium]
MSFPKIIAIAGPTASGKSALGIRLVHWIKSQYCDIVSPNIWTYDVQKIKGAEIISADSRQIYRGMDIGTAKPPISPLRRSRRVAKSCALAKAGAQYYSGDVRHHLVDIRNPGEDYTAAQFKTDALRAIREILHRGKLPILVGGTGLYIKTITDNLDIPRVRPNPKLRRELERELQARGLTHLYNKLVALDPEAAYIVDPKNPRRVIRALEIMTESKKLFSEQRARGERLFTILKIGVAMPGDALRRRIKERVDEMISRGLVDEVRELLKRYPANTPVFDAIGYREIIRHLANRHESDTQISANEIKKIADEIKLNTWHFAKRQMTWFKADKEIQWIKDPKDAESLIRKFLIP